jgi:hypothetical protein
MPPELLSESGREEKRRERRYPFSCDIEAQEMPPSGLSKDRMAPIRGTVFDISSGGLSFLTDHAVQPSTVMRCEIRIYDLPVAIPVLSQARWIQENPGGGTFRIGLQFLI